MKLAKVKGFYPYLIVVFFNSFVDLGHKILIQDILFQTVSGPTYTIFSAIINALILLPYILLFTPSGFIADKFPKAIVLRITATAAIPLTLLITWCYYYGFFLGAFSLTLLLAIQSALNSPAKYGYIKEIFGKEHIAQANAIVQTLTIIAILSATFIFTVIFSHYIKAALLENSIDKYLLLKTVAPIGFILVICSIIETVMTFKLPQKSSVDPKSNYQVSNYFRGNYLKSYLSKTTSNHVIITCICGLAIFWGVNQVLLASYGAFLKDNIPGVSVLFAQGALAVGGIGILLGALYAGKVSKGFIETGLIPVATIGLTLGLLLLPLALSKLTIVLLFLGYGFFGGMLIVPLNSLIQFNAGRRELGKILAANNFVQNCLMISFLILTVLFSMVGLNSVVILYGLFCIALLGAIYALIALPQSLVRYLLYFMVSKFYSLSVYQLNNLPSTGGVLLLGNHISFIDWAVLQIACPRPIRFVMERSISEKWYLRWFLKKFNIIPISKWKSKNALAEINIALNNGEVVALFPEGRLSRNGQLGAFQSGFERAALNAKAVIIPFYIHGLWGAKTSYASDHYKQLSKMTNRKASVIYGDPLDIHSTTAEVYQRVKELSIKSWKFSTEELHSLQTEWLSQTKRTGNALSIIDANGAKFSGYKLLAIVIYFAGKLAKNLTKQQNIGVIFPASSAGVIANLCLLCNGKTVVNLNYTAGEGSLLFAIKQADIKTIVTSRYFIDKLQGKGIDLTPVFADKTIIYLEDYKNKTAKMSIAQNLVLVRLLPTFLLKLLFIHESPVNSTAAILFSSGSEGTPKGVELTHRNLLSNVKQVSSVLAMQESDVVLNSLPLFHAFGLTVTTFMPLIQSIPMVCYPDPTNSLAIAQLIYRNKITLFCSTSTFLGMYCRNTRIHPMMLTSLRLVIAGAEKLSSQVYDEFKKKFNLEIYEGYGATEVAPVASCNLPDVLSPDDWHVHQGNKPGTVGLPLPGCAFRIVDPITLEQLPIGEEGLVLVGGTQVMQGYLDDSEKTRSVLIKEGDFIWYKTGDKGRLDADGYLTIVDRYSRFAKIGGEMVSLGQVEQLAQQVLDTPNLELMAVAFKDDKKGEQVVLLFSGELTEEMATEKLLASDMPKLSLPRKIIKLESLPKLGNGKKDYISAKKIVES